MKIQSIIAATCSHAGHAANDVAWLWPYCLGAQAAGCVEFIASAHWRSTTVGVDA